MMKGVLTCRESSATARKMCARVGCKYMVAHGRKSQLQGHWRAHFCKESPKGRDPKMGNWVSFHHKPS